MNLLTMSSFTSLSYYHYWKKKITFGFFFLSRYQYSLDFIIPSEIIRLILLLYLRYEKQNLRAILQCPCSRKEDVIRWWKSNFIGYRLKYNLIFCVECHKIENTTQFQRCRICCDTFCLDCNDGEDFECPDFDYHNWNSQAYYYYICIRCVKLPIKHPVPHNKCPKCKKNMFFSNSKCKYCNQEYCDRKCLRICMNCDSKFCENCATTKLINGSCHACNGCQCDQCYDRHLQRFI